MGILGETSYNSSWKLYLFSCLLIHIDSTAVGRSESPCKE